MKYSILLITILLFSFTKSDNVVDRIGVNQSLKFNKTTFNLKWTDKPNDTYFIQEYLPKGEVVDSFTQMLTCHLFIANMSIKEAVKSKTNELDLRKKTDGVCNYVVTESPDGKEFIVDFLLGEYEGDLTRIVEFNVYKYKKVKLGKKGNGILVFAYSKRSYGDDITPFFGELRKERRKHLNEMIAFELPKVKIE